MRHARLNLIPKPGRPQSTETRLIFITDEPQMTESQGEENKEVQLIFPMHLLF